MKIEVKNLGKKYKQTVLFENFNLTVHPQEILCIMGKSGSGKTTLLNMLGLIERPDTGEIFYEDEKILHAKQRRNLLGEKIGFVFQNFGLIENETVFENFLILKTMAKLKKAHQKKAILAVLQDMELPEDILNKKVYECSGGEQQRLAIAKIFLKNCDVIFADEPTASLDPENKANIMKHFARLKAQGKTIVIVTHDEKTSQYCDRVVSI